MTETLTWIFLTLVVLLALILSAPIRLEFSGEYAESLSLNGKLNWAGGVFSLEMIRSQGKVSWSMGFFGIQKARPQSSKATAAKTKPRAAKKKKRAGSFGNLTSYLNRQLLAAVKTLLVKLIKALHLNFNLSGTYGFEDPSLTGLAVSLQAVLDPGGSSIDLTPDFTRETAEIRGSIRGWFCPLQLLAIAAVFLLKKPVRAVWWPKVFLRKKQKEAVRYA